MSKRSSSGGREISSSPPQTGRSLRLMYGKGGVLQAELAVVGLAAAAASAFLREVDGWAGDPLVDEAAHHAGAVAAVRVPAVEEFAGAAGTGPGEGYVR